MGRVVTQQVPSSLPESQVNLREWAIRFADGRANTDVRPALLTVWPESERSYALPAVIRSYRGRGEGGATPSCIPPVVAWQAAWRRNPRLPLYGADGFHPSLLGTYLTALVVLAGLTHQPPINRPFRINRPGFRLSVSAARAKLLRDSAAEALKASG